MPSERTFEDTEAVRDKVPLIVSLTGPSGSGKTYSGLALGTGAQRVYGGDLFVIDSESKRALHYAPPFKFRHVPFSAPFGPMDYLAAIEHCVKRGAKTIVIDSMSHEHEGPGGVLEQHDAELERLVATFKSYDKANFPAWAKPKAARRRLLNGIVQLGANVIMCFRAKEKLKMVKVDGRDRPVPQGFCPIGGEEFTYEAMVSILLYPQSGGVPTWTSDEPGEKEIIKLPAQFKSMFTSGRPLNEDVGEALARWAIGDAAPQPKPEAHVIKDVTEEEKRKDGKPTMVYTIVTASGAAFVTRDSALADVAKNAKELECAVTIGATLKAGVNVLDSIAPVPD